MAEVQASKEEVWAALSIMFRELSNSRLGIEFEIESGKAKIRFAVKSDVDQSSLLLTGTFGDDTFEAKYAIFQLDQSVMIRESLLFRLGRFTSERPDALLCVRRLAQHLQVGTAKVSWFKAADWKRLTPATLARLRRIEAFDSYELEQWRRSYSEMSEQQFLEALDYAETVHALQELWLPRVRAYEQECRQINPVVNASKFSAEQSAQMRILQEKMQNWYDKLLEEMGERTLDRFYVVITTQVGLATAQRVFSQSRNFMLFDRSESKEWNARWGKEESDPYGWYELVSFLLDDLSEDRWKPLLEFLRLDSPSSGCKYWSVSVGGLGGSLDVCSRFELWHWDGSNAEYVKSLGYCVS